MGIAELERNRFGWKLRWREELPVRVDLRGDFPSPPAFIVGSRSRSNTDRFLLWGKVFDHRVAAIEIFGTAYPLEPGEPYFIILTPEEPVYEYGRLQQVRLLDASGAPLPWDGGMQW